MKVMDKAALESRRKLSRAQTKREILQLHPSHALASATCVPSSRHARLGRGRPRTMAARQQQLRARVSRGGPASTALLERDQLRAEQKAGLVFTGWEEGRIGFPPTYKYVAGSDAYAMMSVADSSATADGSRSRERKKRTPAW